GAGSADGGDRVLVGRLSSSRRRRDTSSASRRGHLDYRRTQLRQSEAGQIRIALSAGQNPRQRWRARAGNFAGDQRLKGQPFSNSQTGVQSSGFLLKSDRQGWGKMR